MAGRLLPSIWIVSLASAFAAAGWTAWPDDPKVASTIRDFYIPGTQSGQVEEALIEATECSLCHGGYNEEQEPYTRWAASMMGQGARDPMYWAAVAIAEQYAPNVADFCGRCHAPLGWVQRPRPSKSHPTPSYADEGISCSMCHRMVDPEYKPGISPAIDLQILHALPDPPIAPHSAQFVTDPKDRRRGPFSLASNFEHHEWLRSPFHLDSRMCATCHDVSNPLFVRQRDGTYVLDTLDAPHPTQMPYDQFPLERTYSEWSQSAFAQGPIEMHGRFGGNRTTVSSCQDCHMPKTTGTGCNPLVGGQWRADLPQHDFRGATTWMLRAVRNLYGDNETGLTADSVSDAIARNEDMLRRASDIYLAISGGDLLVRVINQTGHKLPTGHLEGRRMWVNVLFFDSSGHLVAERGAYNGQTATLAEDARVYQAIVGLDEAMAAKLGVPPGPSHFFPLNNTFYLDNRIPPRGFTNAGFAAVQAEPIGATYRNGQHWDDSRYTIPPGTTRIKVRLYYQTITREAVEGLRDANRTNRAGVVLYEQWLATGKSAPVEMDNVDLIVPDYCRLDFSGDGLLDTGDCLAFVQLFETRDPRADLTDDGTLQPTDLIAFLNRYAEGCP